MISLRYCDRNTAHTRCKSTNKFVLLLACLYICPMQKIYNDIITVVISRQGAELQSIKKGETEYLWQGDPTFWGRRSPILFPIVGRVWDNKYRVNGKKYELGQHGFARDMAFSLVESSQSEAHYRLLSDENTLDKFPFPFILDVIYKLKGNKIEVIWEVSNPSDSDIYFQIGAHPAFNYPDFEPDKQERIILDFHSEKTLLHTRLKEKGCVDPDPNNKGKLELADGGRLEIGKDTFDTVDTFIFEEGQLNKVSILKTDGTPWLSVDFKTPVVGIWSPPKKNAPFICIEPWFGRCDSVNFDGDFSNKDWVNRLAPGMKFANSYIIEIE